MNGQQPELFGVIWQRRHPFRLRANDVIRVDGRLGWVLRVTESAAIVIMNRPVREFVTRFDKRVRLQPAPLIFRISANAESEIINRMRKRRAGRRAG